MPNYQIITIVVACILIAGIIGAYFFYGRSTDVNISVTNDKKDKEDTNDHLDDFIVTPGRSILEHNDLGELTNVAVSECSKKCYTDNNCRSFEFGYTTDNSDNGKCWLSSSSPYDVGELVYNKNMSLYTKKGMEHSTVEADKFTKYPGMAIKDNNDKGYMDMANPNSCAIRCNDTDGCNSFDYYTNDDMDPYGQCWLSSIKHENAPEISKNKNATLYSK
jgi:hypothetical protein